MTSTLNIQFLPDGTSQVNITVVNLEYPTYEQGAEIAMKLAKVLSEEKESITTLLLPESQPSLQLEPQPQPESNVKRLANVWSAKELDVIKDCCNKKSAVTAYRLAYPSSTRTDNAIEQRWYDVSGKKKEHVIEPAPTPTPKPATIKPGVTVKDVRGTGISKGHSGIVKRVNEKTGDILIQFDNGLSWIPKENCDVVVSGG